MLSCSLHLLCIMCCISYLIQTAPAFICLKVLESLGAKCSSEGRAEGISWFAAGVVEAGRATAAQLPDLLQVTARTASASHTVHSPDT